MNLSSGVDIIEIERIERALNRNGDRFLQRIFTEREQAHCGRRLHSLAGRFALKEAVSKALGTGIGDFNWVDVEIINDDRGKPILCLHNNAQTLANQLGLGQWSVSISHTDTHAIGFAVAIGIEMTTEN